MSFAHGTFVVLQLFTSSGSLDVSADFNSANIKWDKNNPETTTFSKTTVQRISGIRDWSLDFAGIWNTGANTAYSYITADMNASLPTLFKLAPGGSVSGSPVISGCGLFNSFAVNGPVNGPVAMNFSLQASSGSLTSACIA